MFHKLVLLIIQALEIYRYLLLAWIIGSWFPQLRGSKVFAWIDKVVSPYARLFRSIIPAVGGLDFSVILAFFTLILVERVLYTLMAG